MCVAARPAVASLLLLGLLGGCATNTAPYGFLPKPLDALTSGRGAWIELRVIRDGARRSTDGELLAIGPDSAFVLTGAGVVGVPLAAVERAKLTSYQSGSGQLAAWTVGGTLSTISHGIILILSAPIWVLVGSVAAAAESYAPQQRVLGSALASLRPYARFPQGMPAGFTRDAPGPR